ncbi:MAG: TIGR03752 family integrating conjugative element protein [Candidatus Competibacteraceae bacterium]|nr:TIGR03752 family integrating conjugative element protein [Candidatus Competibacteraceae bacterium]
MNLASNRLIPLAAFSVLAMAVWVGIKSIGSDEESAAMGTVPTAPAPDADTPAETIRTLTAEVADLKNRTGELIRQNDALTRENQNLRLDIASAVRAELAGELSRRGIGGPDPTVTELEDRVTELTFRLEQVLADQPAPSSEGGDEGVELPSDSAPLVESLPAPVPVEERSGFDGLPVGQGLEGLTGLKGLAGLGLDSPPKAVPESATALVWVQPLERPELAGNGEDGLAGAGNTSPWETLAAGESIGAGTGIGDGRGDAGLSGVGLPSPAVPFYTIPRNATLIGSTAMTALVGRIPVQGTVQDPMPFKIIVGRDNLAANGITIPGIDGIVASGIATGDWTLSCVRGEITSLTFTFQDGTLVTHSADDGGGGGGGLRGPGGAGGGTGALGWISDDQGIPCVSGKRITNAPSFLAGRIGLIAAQGAAEAYANAQTTTRTSVFGDQSRTVTGDVGAYVAGQTASKGAGEIGTWLQERQAQSFDAVFVRPGVRVAVHLDREIPIDFDPTGRRVSYDHAVDARYTPVLD